MACVQAESRAIIMLMNWSGQLYAVLPDDRRLESIKDGTLILETTA